MWSFTSAPPGWPYSRSWGYYPSGGLDSRLLFCGSFFSWASIDELGIVVVKSPSDHSFEPVLRIRIKQAEKDTDQRLTQLAEERINIKATQGGSTTM